MTATVRETDSVTERDAGAPVQIALIGMGRMGKALDALADSRGCSVVARLTRNDMHAGLAKAQLRGAQVAIDFSTPDAAVDNAVACLTLGCPVVSGTTGWLDRRSEVEAAVAAHRCSALWSPNFSLGVQRFLRAIEQVARQFAGVDDVDAMIVETHHAAKRDAPSGTALAIGEAVEAGLGRAVPITSVRVGSVPGTHEVVFDAPFEQLRFVHEARDRRVFADGALAAARWLAVDRPPALYTMQDMLAPVAPTPP